MFSDPQALAMIAVALVLAAFVTWIAARLVGRRLTKRNPFVAFCLTALAAPAIALACGIVLFKIDSAAYPRSDGPPMALAGAIMISQVMLLATVPTAWFLSRRRKWRVGGDTTCRVASPGDATGGSSTTAVPLTISMTRDSVCMADDIYAPHDETFVVTAADTLADVAAKVAASSYLPMPSDAWGWTIEAEDAVVVIRKGFFYRRVATLQGDPAAIMARDHPILTALYVRPGSRWPDVAKAPSRSGPGGAARATLRRAVFSSTLVGMVALTTACQPGSTGPLEPAPGVPRGAGDVNDRPSALVTAGEIVATVSGSWTTRLEANHTDLRVTYRNAGHRIVTLPGTGFTAQRGADRAETTEASDMTGVDLADARTDNDDGRQIVSVYDGPAKGTIRLLPGETRTVEATASFTDGVIDLDPGQQIWVSVPVSGGTRTIPFSTAGGWL